MPTKKRIQALYFNPHSHEGSDYEQVNAGFIPYISIHTPMKGVTKNGALYLRL